jgi:hypothetical protein
MRQDFVYHILVAQDPLCDLSLARKIMMAIVIVDNLQNLRWLTLATWWQAFISIVVSHGFQILDCCRLGALVGQNSP